MEKNNACTFKAEYFSRLKKIFHSNKIVSQGQKFQKEITF